MKLSSPGLIIVKNSSPLWAYSLLSRENRANCYKMRPIKSTQFCFLPPIRFTYSPPLPNNSLSPLPSLHGEAYICEDHKTHDSHWRKKKSP